MCMYTKRFEVWALARAQTYASLHKMGFYTRVSVIWNVYTCEYLHVNKEVLTVSACKGTDICELHTVDLYTKSTVIWKMHTSEYLHIDKEVLTVSACNGIGICEFPHRGILYKSVHQTKYLIYIIYIYIYICKYKYIYFLIFACIKRGLKCEHSRGHRYMWVCTRWVCIQEYLWSETCILVSICM